MAKKSFKLSVKGALFILNQQRVLVFKALFFVSTHLRRKNMTIQSQTSKAVYVADGTTTTFTVPFYFFNKEIAVYADNTLLSEGTDYTIQGSGDASGGEITFAVAPVAETVITIVRDVELKQLVKFMEGENFPATDYEKSLDRIIMSLQQLRDKVAECVSIPKGSATSGEEITSLLVLVSQNMESITAHPRKY